MADLGAEEKMVGKIKTPQYLGEVKEKILKLKVE